MNMKIASESQDSRQAAAARDKRAAAALAALRAEGWIPRASDAPDDAAGAPGQ